MAKKNKVDQDNVQDVSEFIDQAIAEMRSKEQDKEGEDDATPVKVEEHRPDAFEGQYERLGLSVDEDGKLLVPRRLNEVIDLLDDNDSICVGASSSFFFIGTVAEYKEDIPLIEAFYKATTRRYSSRKNAEELSHPLHERLITEIYSRDLPGEPLTKRFTIAGYEVGKIWLRSEYPKTLHQMRLKLTSEPSRVVEAVEKARKKYNASLTELEAALEAVKEAERILLEEYDLANERIDSLEQYFRDHGTEAERKAFSSGLVRPRL